MGILERGGDGFGFQDFGEDTGEGGGYLSGVRGWVYGLSCWVYSFSLSAHWLAGTQLFYQFFLCAKQDTGFHVQGGSPSSLSLLYFQVSPRLKVIKRILIKIFLELVFSKLSINLKKHLKFYQQNSKQSTKFIIF